MNPKFTPNKLEELWGNPDNWKRGLFYSCQDDPRVIVPKRQKWRGWTLNFAHRSAIPTLIFMTLAACLPVLLLAIFGLADTPAWWTILIFMAAIVYLACWYCSSPARYTNRKHPYRSLTRKQLLRSHCALPAAVRFSSKNDGSVILTRLFRSSGTHSSFSLTRQ
jgi:hypothetical protein